MAPAENTIDMIDEATICSGSVLSIFNVLNLTQHSLFPNIAFLNSAGFFFRPQSSRAQKKM